MNEWRKSSSVNDRLGERIKMNERIKRKKSNRVRHQGSVMLLSPGGPKLGSSQPYCSVLFFFYLVSSSMNGLVEP